MFKLVPVLFPPPLRQARTTTEPPRSPRTERPRGAGRTPSNSGCTVARSPPLPPERRSEGSGAEEEEEEDTDALFRTVFDSNSRLNSLMCFFAHSTTLALPDFRNSPIWRPVSVYLSVRLQRHTCQGAGLPEGVHSGGRLLMWKVFKTLLKCSFHIHDNKCTGGLKTC